MISYQKDLVWTPGTGTMETMSGKLNWSFKYYLAWYEPTGFDVPTCSGNWEGDDYEEEFKETFRKKISKEDYTREY